MDWSHIVEEPPSKHVVEGNVEKRKEMKGRRGRKRKQLIDEFRKRDDSGN
jgi:hypothetical protein